MGLRVACISTSNVIGRGSASASTRVCQLACDVIVEYSSGRAAVEILSLMDLDMKPCRMCGFCYPEGRCRFDEPFNRVFSAMSGCDATVFVVPHYAPFPSKLVMLFEKMEELAFLHYMDEKSEAYPLRGKAAAIIAHGGMVDDESVVRHYRGALLDPIASILGSVGMKVVGVDDEWKTGVAFGCSDLRKVDGQLLPVIEQNWDLIRTRITPLVARLVQSIS